MSETIDIIVPDLGDFSDVDVIEVLVKAGDKVEREQGLITLETDKASMDVPASHHGTIEDLTIAVGDRVSTGDVIGRLTIEVSDTVVITPAIEANVGQGDTTVVASPDVDESASGGRHTLSVPDIGDFTDVDVIEVHVAPGDDIAVDEPLITLESDKAAMDVPAVIAGRIEAVLIKVGDTVSEGSPIAVVLAADRPAEPAARAQAQQSAGIPARPPPRTEPPQAQPGLPPIDEAGFSKAHAGPSVRKLARELGVNLIEVKGSGPKNRILHDDVKAYVKAILTGDRELGAARPKVPTVDFARFGKVATVPLTRIQRIAGPRLTASWLNIPHVTQHDLADVTRMERKRQELKASAKKQGFSLTPLAFILKACIAALKEFPRVNSSLSDDGATLIQKNYYHIGCATDTENGLVVPVIHDADKLNVFELAKALAELATAARAGKLKANQIEGASFTVSSLGSIGGTAFTPIINAPEVAILGVSRSSIRPVWNGKKFLQRLMLPLSLSYDHRVIDGAYAVRFTTFLGEVLLDVDALLEGVD